MAEASFSPRETVFSPINPSLYNSISQLTLHRSPCPSAPSERLGAGGSVAATDALPPTEAWYKLHLLDLKPRKVGPGSHLPLCPQESRHKHPASQQPATSPNSQQSHPPTTHPPPPITPPPRAARLSPRPFHRGGYSWCVTGQATGCNTYPNRIWPCFAAWG